MELLDIEVIKVLLQYGSLSLVFGMITIMPLELLIYGVMKAFSFFRL